MSKEFEEYVNSIFGEVTDNLTPEEIKSLEDAFNAKNIYYENAENNLDNATAALAAYDLNRKTRVLMEKYGINPENPEDVHRPRM